VTLENSIIAGIGRPLSVTTDSKAGTSSTVTTKYTSYEVEKAVKGGTGATITDENVHVIPGEFVNPVTGGDWRLLATSPLLGLGSPKALQAGEYEFDAGGSPRIVNGQRDLGAYENQRRPPLASATASASSVEVGAAVTFDGAGSSVQEPGDSIASYDWRFDDGGAANGVQVAHAFTTPGLHMATVTVTDRMGIPLTGQASVSVNASSPLVMGPGDGGARPIPIDEPLVADSGLRALRISPSAFRARLSGPSVLKGKRGGALVSYTLSESAMVTFTVQRLLPGVRQGKICVRRIAGAHGGGRCTRRLEMRGSFTSVGKVGVNSLRFSGRLAGKRLVRGSYLLLASASGRAAHAPFQIMG
jgi:PKD repeat protein